MNPSSYSYLDEIKRQEDERKVEETVFRALAYSITIGEDKSQGKGHKKKQQYLVGGSNFGQVCIWKHDSLNPDSSCTPIYSFHIQGCSSISKIEFCKGFDDSIALIIATYGGCIYIYRWNEVMIAAGIHAFDSQNLSESSDDLKPSGIINVSDGVESFACFVSANSHNIIVTVGPGGLQQWRVSQNWSIDNSVDSCRYNDDMSYQAIKYKAGKIFTGGEDGCMVRD